jgi:hypothetical protein
MVVRFDLHHDAHAIADVAGAGVFGATAREDVGAFCRKATEEWLRVLVTAVLAPEGAEEAQLDFVRLASEALDDQVIFVATEGYCVEGVLVCGHVFRIRGA